MLASSAGDRIRGGGVLLQRHPGFALKLPGFALELCGAGASRCEDRVLDGPASGEKGSKGRNRPPPTTAVLRHPRRPLQALSRSLYRSLALESDLSVSRFRSVSRSRPRAPSAA